MVIVQTIGITLATGLGNGVTTNKRVSDTRINTSGVCFNAPLSNTGPIRIGHAIWNEQARSFAAPDDPLIDAVALITLEPGASYTPPPLPSNQAELRGFFDLSRFYVQGANANDVVQVNYLVGIDF